MDIFHNIFLLAVSITTLIVGVIGVRTSIIATPFETTIIVIRLVVGMLLITMGIMGWLSPFI